ncbi:uncharacterized protein BDV17DRAFT_209252 [Aspergillus undulatus]|uniref:uncharacterized protein n=1 Tax=Aspergillus undulatus TaxID=1810928 RepID=UPI003CCCF8E6
MKPLILLSLISFSLALSIPPPPVNNNNENLPVPELNPSSQQQPLTNFLEITNTESTSKRESSPVSPRTLRINHGTFVHANKSRTESRHSNASYAVALQSQQSSYRLLERYFDELFALGLLLLVPITLMLVELAERFCRALSVEEFPERGRDMQRIGSLEKRAEWLLRRKEREIQVEKTMRWWKGSRY